MFGFGEPEEKKKSCVDLASASVSVVLSAFFFLFFFQQSAFCVTSLFCCLEPSADRSRSKEEQTQQLGAEAKQRKGESASS